MMMRHATVTRMGGDYRLRSVLEISVSNLRRHGIGRGRRVRRGAQHFNLEKNAVNERTTLEPKPADDGAGEVGEERCGERDGCGKSNSEPPLTLGTDITSTRPQGGVRW